VASSLTALSSDPGALVSALQSAGMAGVTVSVAAPVLKAPPPAPPPPAPPPPAPPPAAPPPANTTDPAEAAAAATQLAESFTSVLSMNASGNLSAAVSAAQTQLASLSGTALGAAQTAMLGTLATMNVSGNAGAAASLVLAVVTARAGETLSPGTQEAALKVLSTVATSGPISAASATSATSALSAVATSAVNGNAGALLSVTSVLGDLATGQAASMVAALDLSGPPPAPLIIISDTIKTLVQVRARDVPTLSRASVRPCSPLLAFAHLCTPTCRRWTRPAATGSARRGCR
jgi:hypothetical protein